MTGHLFGHTRDRLLDSIPKIGMDLIKIVDRSLLDEGLGILEMACDVVDQSFSSQLNCRSLFVLECLGHFLSSLFPAS